MKAVMPVVYPEILESRKRTGADQWDEMWEGVLHMPPMPTNRHQELGSHLEGYVRFNWARRRKAKVFREVNLASVGGWNEDYRVPDLLVLTPERFHIDKDEYFEGWPDGLVEIHSPGDEAYEKLEFYRNLGVPEVWIIHRDTKEPEIYLLKRRSYKKQKPSADGWVRSPLTGLEMRSNKRGKLSIR